MEPVVFGLLPEADRKGHRGMNRILNPKSSNEEVVQGLVEFWFGPAAWTSASSGLRRAMLGAAGQIREQLLEAASLTIPDKTLRQLRVPTLLAAGDRTQPVAHKVLDRLESLLPMTSRVLVEGAGHDSVRTHPQTIASHLASLLK